MSRPWAHPRAGGENTVKTDDGDELKGSSPRGRGKPDWRRRRLVGAGLIPARAGKTNTSPPTETFSRAHPRAGGENTVVYLLIPSLPGSSPRGRGKLQRPELSTFNTRLIPARAGKTPHQQLIHLIPPAHPRAGGENALVAVHFLAHCGSSPCGRGKPSQG